MNESQISAVARFFYFYLQDALLATQATVKTLNRCQNQIQETTDFETAESILVRESKQILRKLKSATAKNNPNLMHEVSFQIPSEVDLGPWKQFKKEAGSDEFESVIWSRLLEFSDNAIAVGLGITTGTLRHRVARGLRHLGRIHV
jgi:hypothetical protein